MLFIILGYGIPKDILQDGNYSRYLNFVFNQIFDRAVGQKATIIFTGGLVDCFQPYQRIEALELKHFFEKKCQSVGMSKQLRQWRLLAEKKSLSTLENLLFSKKLINDYRLKNLEVLIFCEWTRKSRVYRLAQKIFGKKCLVSAIDFDTSANRYLDPKFLQQKEKKAWKYDLWSLRSVVNLKKHHILHQQRIKYLRQAKNADHVQAVQQWWSEALEI